MILIRNEVFEKLINILSKYKYCILRNYEDLPAVSNDIDILIDKSVVTTVIEKLDKELTYINVFLLDITLFSCYSLSFHDRVENIIFHIDLLPRFTWGPLEYLDADIILNTRIKYKSFFIPSPENECMELLLTRLIYQKRVKDKYKPRIVSLYRQNKQNILYNFKELYGKKFATKILNYLEKEEWEKINNHVEKLRLLILSNNIKKYKIFFLNSLFYLKRITTRFINLPGLFVSILGPDGSGKSTIIREILDFLENIFKEEKVRLFHWRPYLKYKKPSLKAVSNPHEKAPYNKFLSLLKLILYFFSYNTGYLTQMLPILFINGLVIFDRYYYDILIDPLRYRYRGSSCIAKCVSKLIPRPNIIFFLDIEPDKLIQRKQELTFEEIKRQRKGYINMAGYVSNAFVIDSSQSVERLKNITGQIILDFLRYRYIKRQHIWFEDKKNESMNWLLSILNLKKVSTYLNSEIQRRYIYLSLKDGRLYLFPYSSIKTLINSFDIYNTQSIKSKIGKIFLKFSCKLGRRNYFLPEVCLGNNGQGVESLLGYIEKVMEYKKLNFAISAGTPGPHRKPVIEVLSKEGEIICYVKVGWNEATDNLVENEALVLKKLYNSSSSFITPRVLYSGFFYDNYICIQSFSKGKIKNVPYNLNFQIIEAIKELASYKKFLKLEESSFWEKINRRLEKIHNNYYLYLLSSCLKQIEEILANEKIPFHFHHGDFAPWNMKIVNDKLYIFDWEYGKPEGLPGWDLLHFFFQTSWLLKKYSPYKFYRAFEEGQDSYEEIARYMNMLNIKKEFIKPIFLLYLVDRLSFYACEAPGDFPKLQYLATLVTFYSGLLK